MARTILEAADILDPAHRHRQAVGPPCQPHEFRADADLDRAVSAG
jgi:hypothetical protein